MKIIRTRQRPFLVLLDAFFTVLAWIGLLSSDGYVNKVLTTIGIARPMPKAAPVARRFVRTPSAAISGACSATRSRTKPSASTTPITSGVLPLPPTVRLPWALDNTRRR